MADYKYLVFSGGGVAGYAFAGAIEQLSHEKDFSLEKIQAVAGVSVGAIASLLVALNYSPLEVKQKLNSINFKGLEDGSCFSRLYRLYYKYGFYKGDALYELIKGFIKEKTGRADPENVTFADLKKLSGKDLHVLTAKFYKVNDEPRSKLKIFSTQKTPNTPVAATVYASAAPPLFFARVRLKKISKGVYSLSSNGTAYGDGGMINNFPIEIFDNPEFFTDDKSTNTKNPHTLGLVLLNANRMTTDNHVEIKTQIEDGAPLEYIKASADAFLQKNSFNPPENDKRAIQISKMGVSSFNFDISEEQKAMLLQSGQDAVKRYFNQPIPFTVAQQFANKRVPVGKLWKTRAEQDVNFVPITGLKPL